MVEEEVVVLDDGDFDEQELAAAIAGGLVKIALEVTSCSLSATCISSQLITFLYEVALGK